MTPIENNIQSSRSISTAAGIPTQDLKCKRFGGKLSFFCEQTEMLACKECQLADKDKGYTYRPTHEVAPDVKASLSQAASDVRLKRNVLGKGHQKYGLIINLFSPTSLSHFFSFADENRSMLGTKLSEVNIKEKSLMTQLQDLKSYLITKLDARFRELQTEVTKIVRAKRKIIEGRKSTLDRMYLQSDYALAFMDYANQFSENDDKAILGIFLKKYFKCHNIIFISIS